MTMATRSGDQSQPSAPTMRDRRYPWEPLHARLIILLGTHQETTKGLQPVGLPTFAAHLGVPAGRVQNWKRRGLTRDHAEAAADRIGEHPYLLWPDMRDHDIADAARAERVCALPWCNHRFVPVVWNHRFCSRRCANMSAASTDKHRERKREEWRRRAAALTEEQREQRRAKAREARRAAREAQLRRRVRVCAADDCAVVFVAENGNQRFHSPACRNRMKMRRYRSTERGADVTRILQRRYDARRREAA